MKDAGLDACKIGTGQILLDFALPTEWSGVEVTYSMDLTGGIELSTGAEPLSTASNYPVSLSLNNKSISAEKIDVDASFNLLLANATIDFRKNPKIGIESNITKISTVTVKLSDTSLSFSYPEKEEDKFPDTVLDIVKSIKLNQCGITGTYTNTLPGDNNKVSLKVFSDFFNIHDSKDDLDGCKFDLESNSENRPLSILGESTTVKLGTNSTEGEKDSIDFNVDVTLPGGDANKITVYDVEPGTTYKFAISLQPVIDWESVTLDTSSLPSKSDKIATGFNPSTILNSIDDVLGKDFSKNIKIPDCNLYLYLTKPDLDALDDLSFNSTSISMFYGKKDGDNPPVKIESFQKDIIKNGKYRDQNNQEQEIDFADAAPDLTIEQIKSIVETKEDGKTVEKEVVTDTVVSKMSASDASCVIKLSDLLTSVPEADVEGAELCIDYAVSLAGLSGDEGITITKEELDNATTNVGSIGIYAIIELPLSFNVAANSTINLKDLINKEDSSESSEESEDDNKDLFGRKDASDLTEIEKYLKVIDTAVINYRLDSFPIKTSDDIEFEITMGDNEKSITKSLSFNTDEAEQIVITNDEVMQLLNMYPLELKTANVEFPSSTSISIPRTKNLDINLQIGISTNGEPIEIFGGNK